MLQTGTLFNILADQMPILAILITFVFHTKVLHRPLEPATAFVALGVFNRVKDSLTSLPSAVNELLSTYVALQRLVTYLNQNEIEDADWDTTEQDIVMEKATVGWPSTGAEEINEGLAPFTLKDMTLKVPVNKFTLVCGPLGSGKTLFVSTYCVCADLSSALFSAKPMLNLVASRPPDHPSPTFPSTPPRPAHPGPLRPGSTTRLPMPLSRATSNTVRSRTTFSLASPCGRSDTERSCARLRC